MSDQRLRDTWRPAMEAILPAGERRKLASTTSAFTNDGRIRADALDAALPALAFTWYLAGTVSTGTNVEREIELPGDIRWTSIRLRAKTGPSGGECTVRLTVDGAEVDTASIQAGETSGRTVGLAATALAGSVVAIDVVTANGVANLTIVASYGVAAT